MSSSVIQFLGGPYDGDQVALAFVGRDRITLPANRALSSPATLLETLTRPAGEPMETITYTPAYAKRGGRRRVYYIAPEIRRERIAR